MPAPTRDQLVKDFETKNPDKKGSAAAFNTYILKRFGASVQGYEKQLEEAQAAAEAERTRYQTDVEERDTRIASLEEQVRKAKPQGYFAPDADVKV